MTFAWLGLITLLSAPALSANPLKSPRRLVNGQTVDLNSLFKWWTNHAGARPLTGWVHVTGSVVGTNSWGWIVQRTTQATRNPKKNREPDGEAEKVSAKILLLHPPLPDLVEFEQLRNQLQSLTRNRAQLADKETLAKNQAQAASKEQKAASRNYNESRALGLQAKQLNQLSDQTKNQLKLVDLQIQQLKNQLAAYPDPDRYLIDCLALEINQQAQGMAVYDHGAVFQ